MEAIAIDYAKASHVSNRFQPIESDESLSTRLESIESDETFSNRFQSIKSESIESDESLSK